jgi:hypothetical protein
LTLLVARARRGGIAIGIQGACMRAELEAAAEEVRSSLALLRRHL